jgi:hypothetical protein
MPMLAAAKDYVLDRFHALSETRLIVRILAALAVLILLYYLVGGLIVHKIDDDTSFTPPNPIAGGSHAVDIAVALMEREVEENGWTPNDPFFLPTATLDNMPNYQLGIVYAVSRFGTALAENLARARGSAQIDPDVDRASGLLRYPGTVWLFDFSTSLAPTASSESQYRAAWRALRDYNQRLSEGNATFDKRADNLIDALERINSDLGSVSAVIDEHLQTKSGFFINFSADDIFYLTKGRLYAYYVLLKALGEDFKDVIAERNLTTVWNEMLESARIGAEQHPWIVFNGAIDSQFVPSHLASQGFVVLRLRTQLREVSQVLQK